MTINISAPTYESGYELLSAFSALVQNAVAGNIATLRSTLNTTAITQGATFPTTSYTSITGVVAAGGAEKVFSVVLTVSENDALTPSSVVTD